MEHNQNQIYSLCPKCSKDVPRIEFDEDDHDKLMLSCTNVVFILIVTFPHILTFTKNNLFRFHRQLITARNIIYITNIIAIHVIFIFVKNVLLNILMILFGKLKSKIKKTFLN